MTLVVNLVRTVSSAKFICCCWRNPWCDCHVTHTPKCNESAKMGQIINCGLTMLIVSVFPVLLTNYDTAQIWRCWQNGRYFYKTHLATLYMSTKRTKREIKEKLGGGKPKTGGPWPIQTPLRIATDWCGGHGHNHWSDSLDKPLSAWESGACINSVTLVSVSARSTLDLATAHTYNQPQPADIFGRAIRNNEIQ